MSGNYLLEFIRVANNVKVTACDPDTGIEAVIVGPASASKKELSDLAIKKLLYVMRKQQN